MAIQIQGNSGTVAEVDGTVFRAQRVRATPLDYGAFGHYRVSSVTGILPAALAAGAVVYSFRWGDATRLGVLLRLKTRFLPLTLFTAATLTDATSFDAYVGRSFSASHTGGTALTPTGNNAKCRTSMATSLMTDLRIASTAALAGGTLTVDANPFVQSIRKANRTNVATGTEETISPTTDGIDLDFDMASGDHPLVFAANEGFVIRNRTVWPVAGTGQLMVTCVWAEVAAF